MAMATVEAVKLTAMGAPASPNPSRKTLRYLFHLEDPDVPTTLPPPPPSEGEASALLLSISSCAAAVFTFTDPAESPTQLDLKRRQLSHVLAAVRCADGGGSVEEAVWAPLIAMLAANLFRRLSPPAHPCLPVDLFEEDSPTVTLAPAWPHLHLVYDILAAVVAKADAGTLRRHVDRGFFRGLLALFQSEDPRERDRLKNVYHQLYSKLPAEREFMRKQMGAALLHHAFDDGRQCGAGELLEIWGSIINGFAVPLKEEHRAFLARVLLPLHRPKGIAWYHRQLSYCMTQFVQKEAALAQVVVRGILRRWPVTNSQKEVLLLEEMEDLVASLENEKQQLEKIAAPLCARVARSSNSSHSQVAERALSMWNSKQFVKMASQSWEQVLPPMIESIEENLKGHWSTSVQQLSMSVKKMLQEMEPELYSKFLLELQHRGSVSAEERKRKRKMRWEKLEMAAKMYSPPQQI